VAKKKNPFAPQEKKSDKMASVRAAKEAKRRDKQDRDIYEQQITEFVLKVRPDLKPDDVEITFVGDLSDCVIHLPDKTGETSKKAYQIKDSI
jgi:hypothetical protein